MELEFKEKTFEKYFSNELARLTKISFSPDAHDEAILGFDDAFCLPVPLLMSRAPFVRRGRWNRRQGIGLRELDHLSKELSDRLPPFRFNMFVQYKRPDFLKSSGAGEWKHWKCPYYRYNTTPHQQDALERIEIQSAGRAATIYASPAFWKADDLWSNALAEKISANSNIASVARLRGHGRYSYKSAGFVGKGHSEAADIESSSLETIANSGLSQEPLPFNTHVKRMASLIWATLADDAESVQRIRMMGERIGAGPLDDGSFSSALTAIELFSDLFESSYFAFG